MGLDRGRNKLADISSRVFTYNPAQRESIASRNPWKVLPSLLLLFFFLFFLSFFFFLENRWRLVFCFFVFRFLGVVDSSHWYSCPRPYIYIRPRKISNFIVWFRSHGFSSLEPQIHRKFSRKRIISRMWINHGDTITKRSRNSAAPGERNRTLNNPAKHCWGQQVSRANSLRPVTYHSRVLFRATGVRRRSDVSLWLKTDRQVLTKLSIYLIFLILFLVIYHYTFLLNLTIKWWTLRTLCFPLLF